MAVNEGPRLAMASAAGQSSNGSPAGTGAMSESDSSSRSVVSYLAPAVRGIPCSQLVRRGPELAQAIGYGYGGITKGSFAAEGMSREARACGGGVPSLSEGGVSASLQSIGATGVIKPQAMYNLSCAMERAGLKSAESRVQLLR